MFFKPKQFLIWAGGGDAAALQGSTNATNAIMGMGGTVIATAVLATGAMALAMHDLLNVPTGAAIAIGLAWGLMILNLDRWMVATTRRQAKWWLTISMAIPRILLAAVIAIVIAEPLVLRMFHNEVTGQARADKQQTLTDDLRKADETYAVIPKLEKRQAQLQATLRTGTNAQYLQNPEFIQADTAHNKARDAVAKAQIAAGCEAGGTCGTGRVGCGPVCRAKSNVLEQRKREASESYRRLQAVRTRLSREDIRSGELARDQARPELTRISKELDRLRAERGQADAKSQQTFRDDIGLLDREEALAKLSDERPAVGRTADILRLLLLLMDIVPILFKTLQLLGKESTAELLQRRAEEHEATRAETTETAHDRAHEIATDLIVVEAQKKKAADEKELDVMLPQLAAIQSMVWQKTIDDYRDGVSAAIGGPGPRGLPGAGTGARGARRP